MDIITAMLYSLERNKNTLIRETKEELELVNDANELEKEEKRKRINRNAAESLLKIFEIDSLSETIDETASLFGKTKGKNI